MARKTSSNRRASKPAKHPLRLLREVTFWVTLVSLIALLVAALVHRTLLPSPTFYMKQEAHRLGSIDHEWVPIAQIAPVMARAVVAAEDANFCLHWGFDMRAIRTVIEQGETRGASTLSQQTVKNAYLWQGRTWVRKALEALMTPVVEAMWSKRRIVEVYLNIAEFDEGVFGVGAAAHHYFGVSAADLTDRQAARLASVLPNPKDRSASNPTDFLRKRTASIMDGAATIRRDGRAACFED